MKLMILFVTGLLLISCNNSPLVKNLEGSDSLAVRFNYPGTDSIVKIVETTEPHAIEKLLQFAGAKETDQFKCGYDGKAMFYKKGSLAGDISFNFSADGCHHFLHLAEGKLTATRMNNEAADFLKTLADGKR